MPRVKELNLSHDIFENIIFHLHLRCFRLYGYVASKDQCRPWLSLARCIFFTACIWLTCVLMLARVFQGYESLIDGAITCATTVQYLAVSISTLNAIVQRKRVISLLREINVDMQQLMISADGDEWDLLLSTQKYTRKITLILWVPSMVAGLMAWSDCIYRTLFMPETVFNMPAVRAGKEQPILLFKLYPFGELCDNFVIGYLSPWYALCLGITTIPLWHTFITCLMKYMHLKLMILKKKAAEMDITRLNPFLDLDRLTPAQLNRWQMELIKTFVKDHLKIRRFVYELEQLIRVPVMADFIIFSVLICFLFFALSVGSPSKIDNLFMFLYIFVMASILWMYHWHATLIAECHEELSFAYYSAPWYAYDQTMKRTILLMIVHAQRPMKMRAVMVQLSVETFIDIVRGAYTYFNILSQLY
ncbi:odorant receptor 56a-like [Drosophila subobscura]|uniref:odorant receptor 56a-like n=1 Tax=Drosophila subobscura TaxID=7241 RepID=UPI00155AC12C|nr:odorant receptor 56a-like [Drosophila subobscura]